MKIFGADARTYLYVNGLRPCRPVKLSDFVDLQPVRCSPSPDVITRSASSEVDIGVMAIFLRQATAELVVVGGAAQDVAAKAWNTVWDAVLLGALFHCEAVCNFQSDYSAAEVDRSTTLRVTNYHLRGLTDAPRVLSEDECAWIEGYLPAARGLLKNERFQTAVQALASYRWNPHPRVRLAVLWAGVEALFAIDQELAFRLSLYTARFLAPEYDDERRRIFDSTKKLYRQRSVAVHGGTMKGDSGIAESASLLLALVRESVVRGATPDTAALAP